MRQRITLGFKVEPVSASSTVVDCFRMAMVVVIFASLDA